MENITVKDFMTSQMATLEPDFTITKALRILLEHHQSGAAVVDQDNNLVGLVSEADCMKTTLTRTIYPGSVTTVAEEMSTQLQTVSPETKLVTAAEMLLKHKRRMLPVVEDGKLVGTITRHHVLAALLEAIDTPLFT
jgi:CBS domain-containing protein